MESKRGRGLRRLKDFDYTKHGAYFITFVTKFRRKFLGAFIGDRLVLSPAGEMVHEVWNAIPEYYPGVDVDEFVVMPDHVHGIVILKRAPSELAEHRAPNHAPLSLPAVMQRLKSLTTNRYMQGVREAGWPPFTKSLWQRNYYERIVRDARPTRDIRRYIKLNPATWVWRRRCAANPAT